MMMISHDVERIIDASSCATCQSHHAKRRADLDSIFIARPDLMTVFRSYLDAHKHLQMLAEREAIRDDVRTLDEEYARRKVAADGELVQLVALRRSYDEQMEIARARFVETEKLRRSLKKDAVPDAPQLPSLGDAREHKTVSPVVSCEHQEGGCSGGGSSGGGSSSSCSSELLF